MTDQGSGIGDQGSGTARRKRSWIPIVIGIVLLGAMLSLGVTALTIWWFRQNISISQTGEDAATEQFEAVRRRYPGQQPLIQLVDGRPQVVGDPNPPSATPPSLSSIHVLAYDRDEGNTVSFALPFWLVRMKSGPIRISSCQSDWDDRGVSFRVEDIEKRGPGIIVDVNERDQGRVLIWAQ